MFDSLQYLIIPDVHGRTFWRGPVNEVLKNTDKKIVFLGDYLDPYQYEDIYPVDAIKVFEEIVELKKRNADRIILLLGNHDVEYLDFRAHKCRYDSANHEKITNIFLDNIDFFDFMYTDEVNGKRFIFSHAGFTPAWIQRNCENIPAFELNDEMNSEQIWNRASDVEVILNTNWKDLYFNGDKSQKHMFNDVSYWRGGGDEYSSCIWSDVKETINILEHTAGINAVQIVGHSQQETKPIRYGDSLYCLDVRRCFILTKEGNVTELDGSELDDNGKKRLDDYFEAVEKMSGFFW